MQFHANQSWRPVGDMQSRVHQSLNGWTIVENMQSQFQSINEWRPVGSMQPHIDQSLNEWRPEGNIQSHVHQSPNESRQVGNMQANVLPPNIPNEALPTLLANDSVYVRTTSIYKYT